MSTKEKIYCIYFGKMIKLNYRIGEDIDMEKEMKNRRNKGMFKALDLAKYLNSFHNEKYGRNISPLKLQKVLFFLFGEWGAFVSKPNIKNEEFGDWKDLKIFPRYLFEDEIQAWLYGPVVKDVYDNFKNETMDYNELFKTEEEKYVGEFIKDLSSELFRLSDFRLVELTHQMNCWKNSYSENEMFHNTVINKEDIINEFLLQL